MRFIRLALGTIFFTILGLLLGILGIGLMLGDSGDKRGATLYGRWEPLAVVALFAIAGFLIWRGARKMPLLASLGSDEQGTQTVSESRVALGVLALLGGLSICPVGFGLLLSEGPQEPDGRISWSPGTPYLALLAFAGSTALIVLANSLFKKPK